MIFKVIRKIQFIRKMENIIPSLRTICSMKMFIAGFKGSTNIKLQCVAGNTATWKSGGDLCSHRQFLTVSLNLYV